MKSQEQQQIKRGFDTITTEVDFRLFVENFDELSKSNKALETTKVIQTLDEILSNPKCDFFQKVEKGKRLFRARQVKSSDYGKKENGIDAYIDESGKLVTRGFDAFDSKEPPLGIPMSARNNIDGVSYLYLTEDEYTACSEIRPSPKSCISLASFELMRDINVIDFTNSQKSVKDFLYLHDTLDITPAIMMTRIMSKFSEYKEDETVYRITQYISDRIRKTGVDGIKYTSSLTHGTDFTLFNSHQSIVKYVSSKLLYSWFHDYKFVDVEANQMVSNQNRPDDWDDQMTETVKKELVDGIRERHTKSR